MKYIISLYLSLLCLTSFGQSTKYNPYTTNATGASVNAQNGGLTNLSTLDVGGAGTPFTVRGNSLFSGNLSASNVSVSGVLNADGSNLRGTLTNNTSGIARSATNLLGLLPATQISNNASIIPAGAHYDDGTSDMAVNGPNGEPVYAVSGVTNTVYSFMGGANDDLNGGIEYYCKSTSTPGYLYTIGTNLYGVKSLVPPPQPGVLSYYTNDAALGGVFYLSSLTPNATVTASVIPITNNLYGNFIGNGAGLYGVPIAAVGVTGPFSHGATNYAIGHLNWIVGTVSGTAGGHLMVCSTAIAGVEIGWNIATLSDNAQYQILEILTNTSPATYLVQQLGGGAIVNTYVATTNAVIYHNAADFHDIDNNPGSAMDNGGGWVVNGLQGKNIHNNGVLTWANGSNTFMNFIGNDGDPNHSALVTSSYSNNSITIVYGSASSASLVVSNGMIYSGQNMTFTAGHYLQLPTNNVVVINSGNLTNTNNITTSTLKVTDNAVGLTVGKLTVTNGVSFQTGAAPFALWQSDSTGSGTWTLSPKLSAFTATNGLITTFTYPAAGQTGAKTINQAAGDIRIAAAAGSVVLTDNLITANTRVFAQLSTSDTTAKSVTVSQGGIGSCTFTLNANATAEVQITWYLVNALQ